MIEIELIALIRIASRKQHDSTSHYLFSANGQLIEMEYCVAFICCRNVRDSDADMPMTMHLNCIFNRHLDGSMTANSDHILLLLLYQYGR